jgi:hypothetical protein
VSFMREIVGAGAKGPPNSACFGALY